MTSRLGTGKPLTIFYGVPSRFLTLPMQTMTEVARSLMPADDLPGIWLEKTVEDTLAWRFFRNKMAES